MHLAPDIMYFLCLETVSGFATSSHYIEWKVLADSWIWLNGAGIGAEKGLWRQHRKLQSHPNRSDQTARIALMPQCVLTIELLSTGSVQRIKGEDHDASLRDAASGMHLWLCLAQRVKSISNVAPRLTYNVVDVSAAAESWCPTLTERQGLPKLVICSTHTWRSSDQELNSCEQ